MASSICSDLHKYDSNKEDKHYALKGVKLNTLNTQVLAGSVTKVGRCDGAYFLDDDGNSYSKVVFTSHLIQFIHNAG